MGRANCPQVAPDRFTRPGILPGVLVVTLPVVEGDIAFLQGHALAVEQRQTGRTQGIIAPFFSLGTLLLPLLGFTPLAISNSIASRSCWRGENQCPSAGATPFHGALLGRGTEAGLAHMANRHHGVVGLADQSPGVGGVVQYGRGLLHHLAEGGTDIGRATLLWKRYHFSANHVRNILDGARAAFTLLTVETRNNARKKRRQLDSRR